MSTNIDSILDKITNENVEINCRAMFNLLNKINNNIISLPQIDDRMAYKFLFSISKWLSMYIMYFQQIKYDPNLPIYVLELFKKCVDIFPPSAIQNLKKEFKISALINDVSSLNKEFTPICDQIQNSVSRAAINMVNNIKSQSQEIPNLIENQNPNRINYDIPNMSQTSPNMININNTVNLKSETVNNKNNNFNETMTDVNNTMNLNKNEINNQNNSVRNTLSENLNNLNKGTSQNINSQNINIQQTTNSSLPINNNNINTTNNFYSVNNNKNSSTIINPSLIIIHDSLNTVSNMSKTMSKITNKDEIDNKIQEKNQNNIGTFAKSLIPQLEEQFIFDIAINLKYGDSLQIFHSFNILYTQILNDIPIEYLLYCDEMMKNICLITETCDFLEFGVLCYKILDKILNLIQKKISLELNNLSSLSNLKPLENSLPQNFDFSQDTSKVESFLYYLLTSVLIAMNNNISKLSFYLPLVEKTLNLLNQVIMIYPNYYEVLYKILLNFDKIVNNYKSKNIDISNFFIFLLKTYINMDNDTLLDLIENLDFDYEIEVIQFIKNIFFTIYNNNTNPLTQSLCLNLLNKFNTLKEDSDKINTFLIDYNNANLISKSIQMTKEMLNGNFDTQLIIDNFYNILLTLKFFNNSPSESEFNSIFPNNSTPLIKAICDFYIENQNYNYEKASDLLLKLLSFKTSDKTEITLSIYSSIYDELKVKGKIVYPLFTNNRILNILFNDLTIDIYKDIILEIIFLLFNDLDDEINENNPNTNMMKQYFFLLPTFPQNFKFLSLQNKLESSMSYNEIYSKYLRNLFSKNESIRHNAIKFFKNNNNNGNNIEGENYENIDTIYCIQTGENEMIKTLKTINDKTNLIVSNTNEFLPLLNILMSNKIDTNMKSSALNQLILMIKNTNYKSYYLNEILSYIIKELEIDINKYDVTTLSNYYYSLIKLLTLIIFIYLNEEIIQKFLNPSNNSTKTLLNNLIAISLRDETSHHLLSSFALIFINIYAFYYRENNNIYNTEMNTGTLNETLPVLKFFNEYYYINIVPTKYVENIFIGGNGYDVNISNSILNFSITKNIIDFIHYMKNPLIKSNDIDSLKAKIKNLKSLDLLGVLTLLTKFFEYNSLYYAYQNDFSDALLQIMFYFKRIIPNKPENKNIIMDFLSILDISLCTDVTGELLSSYKNIFFPFIPDYLLKIFHYISIEKEFINTLADNIENQNFVYQLLDFICNNPIFFPFNRKDELCINILSKFLETYHNIFIFNSQTNFYRVKIGLIRFENIFFNETLNLKLNEKVYSDKINSLVFFLSKYEPVITFNSYNYLLWSLKYITQLIKIRKSIDVLETKTYIFIKLLQSPFIEIKICSLNILKNLFSKELFEKHGTILYDIYHAIKTVKSKILRVNYFSFLIKSLEFILQQKSYDNDDNDQFSNELLTANAQITDQAELINLLNNVLNNKNYDSLYCSLVLKYFNICLNINLENDEYANGIFFGFSFFDLLNDIILKETDILQNIIKINIDNDQYIEGKPYGILFYNDYNKKEKLCMNMALQSILCITEGLNLFIRGLNLLTNEFVNKYKTNITEDILNLISYGELVSLSWNKWKLLNDVYHTKILQSYVVKFYACIYFIFTSDLIKTKDIFPINSEIYQKLNNICYDFMKFESQQNELDPTIKIMFTKILPFLLSMNEKCNSEPSSKNNKKNIKNNNNKKTTDLKLKNDGDTLLEVMNVIKKVYNIKFEVYGDKMKCEFKISEENLDIKNDLLNSLGTLLIQSQNCKKIFVRSKFINTFIDYIYQLQFFLLNENIEKKQRNNLNNTTSKNFSNTNTNVNFMNNSLYNYVVNEFKSVLMLFQNLMYNFNKCEERKLLFISTKESKVKFLELLYNIFYDTLKNNILFEHYIKLLLNIISNSNGDLTNYLVLNLKTIKNDSLIDLIISHFTSSINYLSSNANFEFYINFLTCLFRYTAISNKLLKSKFDENLKSIINDSLHNRKATENKNIIRLIGNLIKLCMSLSINDQHAKKFGNKDFLLLLNEFVHKIDNEEVIYNILFFFRNISFVSSCKNVFVKNGDLMKGIFNMLIDENTTIKIRFILSHLIWILLYDNQTLKTALNKNEFLQEIKNLNVHLQKENDMNKIQSQYGNILNEEEKTKTNEDYYYEDNNLNGRDIQDKNDNDEKKKEREYLENTCLVIRKILHILEI